MRLSLVFLQFPFLYCIGVFIGLEIYGSDFEGVAGYLYLIPLILIPFFHYLYPKVFRRIPKIVLYAVLYAGIFCGTVAYRRLHVGFWDEHSISQAALIAGLGMFSMFAASGAEYIRNQGAAIKPVYLSSGLASVGLIYLVAYWYPMFPFLGIVIIMALATSIERFDRWKSIKGGPMPDISVSVPRSTGLAYALLFWLAAEMAWIPCDYRSESFWGVSLALLFTAASLGPLVALSGRSLIRYGPLYIGLASSLAAALHPSWIINPVHSILLGTVLGWTVTLIMFRKPGGSAILMTSLIFTSGMVLSSAYCSQLIAFPQGKLIFMVPALTAFAVNRRQQ